MAWRQALSQVWASPGEDPPLNQLSETLPWGGRGAKEPVRHTTPSPVVRSQPPGPSSQNQRSAVTTCSIRHILPPENASVRGQSSLADDDWRQGYNRAHAFQFVHRLDACEAGSAQVGQGRAIQLAII